MNGFDQYSFASAFSHTADDLAEQVQSILLTDQPRRKTLANELRAVALKGARMQGRGLAYEGARAGADGLALCAIWIEVEAYDIPEARTLTVDIRSFAQKLETFLANWTSAMDVLPRD